VAAPQRRHDPWQEGSEKSYWNKIGAAFPHKDGKGHDVVLDGGGKIVLRMRMEEREIQA